MQSSQLVRFFFFILFVVLSALAIQLAGNVTYEASAGKDFLVNAVAVLIAATITFCLFRICCLIGGKTKKNAS